jgi:hypothetical protein
VTQRGLLIVQQEQLLRLAVSDYSIPSLKAALSGEAQC